MIRLEKVDELKFNEFLDKVFYRVSYMYQGDSPEVLSQIYKIVQSGVDKQIESLFSKKIFVDETAEKIMDSQEMKYLIRSR